MTFADYNDMVRASTCTDYGVDCCGPVEFHAVGSTSYAWPRCAHHAARNRRVHEQAIRQEENTGAAIQDRRASE